MNRKHFSRRTAIQRGLAAAIALGSIMLWRLAPTQPVEAQEARCDSNQQIEDCANPHWYRDSADDQSTPATASPPVTTYVSRSVGSTTVHYITIVQTQQPMLAQSDVISTSISEYNQGTISTTAAASKTIYMKYSCPQNTINSTTIKWTATLNQRCNSSGNPDAQDALANYVNGVTSDGRADGDSTVSFTTIPAGGSLTSSGSADIYNADGGIGASWSVGFPAAVGVGASFNSDHSWTATTHPPGTGIVTNNFNTGTATIASATAEMSSDADIEWDYSPIGQFAGTGIAGLTAFNIH
jgi:hypothetical protein